MTNVVGCTANAETFCADCGAAEFGEWVKTGEGDTPIDSAGNEIGVIFDSHEWDHPIACNMCWEDIPVNVIGDYCA